MEYLRTNRLLLTAGFLLFTITLPAQSKTVRHTPARLYIDSIRNLLSGHNLAIASNPANRIVLRIPASRNSSLTERTSITCGYFCGNIILPVTGLELAGRRVNNSTVALNWKTFTEINSAGFFIERSLASSGNFIRQAFVPGAGNSTTTQYYQANDPNNFNGISYYRIRQTDIDSTMHFSNIIAVKGFSNKPFLQVFPNPGTNTSLSFAITGLNPNEPVSITITDVLGRILKTKNNVLVQGNIPLQSITKLATGFYMVSISCSSVNLSASFVVTE